MIKNIFISAVFLSACSANGLLNDLLSDSPVENADITPFFPADRAYVFVTSQITKGDMQGLTAGGCSGGGVTQADCACTALAKSANLLRRRDSKFVAWLSTGADYARCRVLGLSGTAACNTGGENWYATDNTLFSAGIAPMLNASGSGPLTAGLSLTEKNIPSGAGNAYTGTLGNNTPPTSLASSGSVAGNTCNSWVQNNTVSGETGILFGNTYSWTQYGSQTCDQQLAVYCFALP